MLTFLMLRCLRTAPQAAVPKLLVAVMLFLALPGAAFAQTLARPGWAGSGVSVEPWWQRAVFYRIQPALFQDSDGDGLGDVAGIAQRLDYLQSLGVDAIVLDGPLSPDALDSLAFEASRHHLRLLVTLDFAGHATLAQARQFLHSGAAGFSLRPGGLTPSLLHDLRSLTDSVPGDRILVADSGLGPGPALGPDPALAKALAQCVQLVAAPPLSGITPAAIRAQAQATLVNPHNTANPLLSFSLPYAATPAQRDNLNPSLAALLLASRTAVLLDAGTEIGLSPNSPMQWTPANITPQRPAVEVAEGKPAISTPAPNPEVYGSYKPYVAPKPVKLPKPLAVADTPLPVDLNTLPGFTTGHLTTPPPPDAATRNVAVEDIDAHSLLNFYRRLIQLHHGNPTLRNGSQHFFDHDADNSLVWIRRAPAGTRTSATVIAVCNLSEQTLVISLAHDLEQLQIQLGSLRPLLTSSKSIPLENTDRFILPPHTVYLGELWHGGTRARP